VLEGSWLPLARPHDRREAPGPPSRLPGVNSTPGLRCLRLPDAPPVSPVALRPPRVTAVLACDALPCFAMLRSVYG
jgi:hypothetical protein